MNRLSIKQRSSALSLGVLLILSIVLYFYTGWPFYLVWLLIINLLTLGLYGFDKGQAKLNGFRIPEIVLHLVAILGGFLGGWAGRSLFRHKTQKGVFTLVLVFATVLHVAGVVWYLAS